MRVDPLKEGKGMTDILDPTIATDREHIDYVARPAQLRGLRIGLIENTKKNSEAVLRKVAERLSAAHGMTLKVLVHKDQRAPLEDVQLAELQGRVDFAITGVGD
jgi:predicted TIM-barrel fold metal-dependent hydrolase